MRWLLFFATLLCGDALGALTEDALGSIRFDQKIGESVDLALQFHDERGRAVKLGDCLTGHPAILIPGYYGCPMLCTLVLNGAVETLRNLRMTSGADYDVICFSINPGESSALAAAKKANYTRNYGRGEGGWHFLVSDEATSRELSREIGFHYLYDPESKQYAHPSGFVVLTPRGRVSRYFFGVDFSARELDQALIAAAHEGRGVKIGELLLLCFHYNPITGKYGPLIMQIVRFSGVGTMLALGFLVWTGAFKRRVG